MEQIKLEIVTVDEIFLEFENEHHKNIVNCAMKEELFKGKLSYATNKRQLIDWFCKRFFEFDLEVSVGELVEIARGNGVKL